MKNKLKLSGDKTYEFLLPPKVIEAMGGENKWFHLAITEEKETDITRYYIDCVEKEKIDWSEHEK